MLPSQDAFGVAPEGLDAVAPGTVLRSRRVNVAMFGVVRQQVSAWQLLYRSTDMDGRPEVAVTTVLVAGDADPRLPRPLLAFQSAIDAVTECCAPSYALCHGARALGSITQLEWLLMIVPALRRGWAVSVADHGGPQGNFGAPREPGYRALDGIRAALAFRPLGLTPDAPVVLWGYSGGGMASSWAVEMAPGYAPELDIVGAVLGSPVGDPGEVFLRLNGGLFAGFPAMVIAALRRLYPVLDRLTRDHLAETGLPLLARAEQLPPLRTLMHLANHNLDDHLTRPLAQLWADPELLVLLEDLRLGNNIPTCPLLVVQPMYDQVIHRAAVDGQVARYDRGGAEVTYIRDRLSEHFTLLALATPLSLNWLEARIAGNPQHQTGSHTVWSIALHRASLRGYLDMAVGIARAALSWPLRSSPPPPIPAVRRGPMPRAAG
ncbi:lipase family protein [Nocardia sp. NPDC050406]|uniref:lipase family protein n=1 Tax=Nocardia sp. NPDC050406 TaxID=3364318 RepID=UPI0037A982F4